MKLFSTRSIFTSQNSPKITLRRHEAGFAIFFYKFFIKINFREPKKAFKKTLSIFKRSRQTNPGKLIQSDMVFNSDSNDCNLSSLVLPGGEKIIRLSDTGLCGAFRAMRILALEFVSKNENRSRKRRGAKCPRKGHTVL